ncbi:p-hydroxybenzoic acid efflux pump subunit AaeB [Desulfuromonas sp. DDH964]|uniref:FUSC family protein n=1 Tax=Desulfuromonas sp. DDH964 TaxID=1823759 RepID=UPI00078BC1D3|nr:FUSC family protein [Desulfuromonas sp. DDH964]AMV71075.1 p-hydroxybenzoic acid efflux pump subunit AaeB [Desulfuromonas sp. DDH964]
MIQHKSRFHIAVPWPTIALVLRNTAAALAALMAAMFLQLENPYWAAMTALIVIQPTRGLLFEKSFYRLVGTAIGAVAGLLLLRQTESPLVLTIALALWIAGCVGIGNLLYGLRSYACMMAGFTSVVIAMSGYHHSSHLYGIALGRIADVFIGIIVATAGTVFFTPRQPRDELGSRLRQVAGKSVAWLALLLRQRRTGQLVSLEQGILIEIAEIEHQLDVVGAGSLRFKNQKRQIRSLMAAQLALLAVGRLAAESLARHPDVAHQQAYWRDLLACHLDEVAGKLASATRVNCLAAMTAAAAEAKAHLPLLGATLEEIVTSLQRVLTHSGSMTVLAEERPLPGLVRQQDRREACRAAIRAALAILAVGITWSATGWTQGPLMLMAMSIMLSIFSSKEHPVAFVGQIFIGAAIGSATAVFCRLILLPGINDPLLAGALLAPFLLLGVLAMSQRRTAISATDATLFFLFVSQPGVAMDVVPQDLVLAAIAMVMGVGGAWLAYRFLVPVSPATRMRSLLDAIARDIEALLPAVAPAAQERLQARVQHRVLRLVAMARQYDKDHLRMVEGGLASLAICRCIQRLQEGQKGESRAPSAASLIEDTLHSLALFVRSPQGVLPFPAAVSNACHGGVEAVFDRERAPELTVADALRDAGCLIRGNVAFLRAGAGHTLPEIHGVR